MSMKTHLATILIALIVGFFGGISSQLFHFKTTAVEQGKEEQDTDHSIPLQMQAESSDVTSHLTKMQQKIDWLEMQLTKIVQNQAAVNTSLKDTTKRSTEEIITQLPAVSTKDNLMLAGVNSDVVDDILRRISQQEFRSIELRNLMRRNASSGTLEYRDELRKLDQNRISLRSELGDDQYDQYLIASGLNNRVKVSSVMDGSPAKSSGLQKGDVILYYGDQKIVSVNDMRKVALEGDIGSLTNIVILRSGNRMNFAVPRGALGVQLTAIQIDPTQ